MDFPKAFDTMIWRVVLCTILCTATIGCYSVSEEGSELDEPAPTVLPASPLSQDKSVGAGKQNKSIKSESATDETESSNPYNDELPLKAVKYKNYGYFNPSVATIKISKQLAAAKPDAFAGPAAAGPAGVQFKQNRNVQAQIGLNGTATGPKFHFQRRMGEGQQTEVEEGGDSVNVRDLNRKAKPSGLARSTDPFYSRKTDRTKYITIIDSPRASINADDKAFTSSKRKPHVRVLTSRVGGSRRAYERNLKLETAVLEKDGDESLTDKPEVSPKESVSAKKNVEVDSMLEEANLEKEASGPNYFGNKADKVVEKVEEAVTPGSDSTGQPVKLKSHWKAPVQYPALTHLRRRPETAERVDKDENESEKQRKILDEQDESLDGGSFDENVAENEASASTHDDMAGDDVAEFDRQYRRLARVQPFSARERSRPRHLKERSLDDTLEEQNFEKIGATMDLVQSPIEKDAFFPTPPPGMVYPDFNDTAIIGSMNTSAPNESKGPPSGFLPTRPPGDVSIEEDTFPTVDRSANKNGSGDTLSTYYSGDVNGTKASSESTMIFVTAPTYTIDDFINAFANSTEFTNRHRDPTEDVSTIPLHKAAVGSVTSTVSNSAQNHFLALEPHFSSSSSPLDLESPREIKYPCTCDKGKCGCCTGRILSNFNLNLPSRGCLNITYIPEDFEFNVKMTYNDRTLAQRRISGKNPRPMCVPLPRISGRAQACVKMSNVYLVGRNVHLCLDLEARVQNEELFKVSFDCVRMGSNGIKWIKPEDGGGLGPPPVVEGPAPEDYDAVVASEGDEITSAKRTVKKPAGPSKEKVNEKKTKKDKDEDEDDDDDDDELF